MKPAPKPGWTALNHPFPYPFCTKPWGITARPYNSHRGSCTMLRAMEMTWTCTGLYAAHYISYMGGNSFRTTTNYLVNPKITADPQLPTTAPLSSTAQCQARVIHRQTSDLLLCCVSPPPCSCPQSPIKSVWDFLNYPLPANRCGKRMP